MDKNKSISLFMMNYNFDFCNLAFSVLIFYIKKFRENAGADQASLRTYRRVLALYCPQNFMLWHLPIFFLIFLRGCSVIIFEIVQRTEKSLRLKKSVLSLLLRILKKFKVESLYIVVKDSRYIQVLKIWNIVPDLQGIEKLVDRLDWIFKRYTVGFICLCREKWFEGYAVLPSYFLFDFAWTLDYASLESYKKQMFHHLLVYLVASDSWPPSLDVPQLIDLSITETPNDFVENSKVCDSWLLMKFYSLSSVVMDVLLSDHKGREFDLPFELTDQEKETFILYNWKGEWITVVLWGFIPHFH